MRVSCSVRVLVSAMLLLVQSAVTGQSNVPGQRADAGAQGQPAFRGGVDLIDVDVFVTDREGNFVPDLTIEDFEILEDGRTQEVRTFSLVDLPVPDPLSSTPSFEEPEPDTATNTGPEGRIYVILMDSPSTIQPGGAREGAVYNEFARRFAHRFVDEMLAPGDQMAVVHAQGTFTDAQGFTTGRSLVRTSIDRYGRGRSGAVGGEITGPEMVARHLATYRAFEDIATRLGAMSGRRKAILWIGGQLRFDTANAPCPTPDPRNLCAISRSTGIILAAYRDAIRAAARNNVVVYPIDPMGLTRELGAAELERTASLRMVAEDTGGIAVVGTNNLSSGYRAIVRDTSTYYVLGYSPAQERTDGRFHRIEVRVKRPGVSVRSRKGYYAADAVARAPVPAPEGMSVAARDALRMPMPVKGLALDVFAAAFKGEGGEGSVVIGGQIGGDLRLDPKETITVSYQVLTTEGKIQAGEYTSLSLDLRPETVARARRTGLRFVERVSVPPGRYEIRVAADQSGGPLGAVVAHVEVPQYRDDLAISGLVVAAASTKDHPTLFGDDALRAVLGVEPTAVRRFPRGDVVTVFGELYSRERNVKREDLTVTGILRTVSGTEIAREAGRWTAGGDAGGWRFTIQPGLDVPAGRYVLTVEATSARRPSRPVRRQVLVTVE